MPPQHPSVHQRPRWRNRLAGWLRGLAEVIDPKPFGLDLDGAPEAWAEHVRAAARRAGMDARARRQRHWSLLGRRMRPAASPDLPRSSETVDPERLGARAGARASAARVADARHPSAQQAGNEGTRTGPLVRPRRARTAEPVAQRGEATPAPRAAAGGRSAGGGGPEPTVRPRSGGPRSSAEVPAARPEPAGDRFGVNALATGDHRGSQERVVARPSVGWIGLGQPEAPRGRVETGHPGRTPDDARVGLGGSGVAEFPERTRDYDETTLAGRRAPKSGGAESGGAESGGAESRGAESGARQERAGQWRISQVPPYLPDAAVLPDSLWPELPSRPPAAPVPAYPVLALLRRERLQAEQGAT